MPFLYVLAPMHSLACPVDCIGAAGFPMSAGSAFGGLRLGSHLPVELVAAFFLGIHYIYLDNSPLLQSFGCKWPVPSRWKTMVSFVPRAAGTAFPGSLSLTHMNYAHDRRRLASPYWQFVFWWGQGRS